MQVYSRKKDHINIEMSRDNWNRLVVAVVRREQIWQMFHDHSRTPSISTIASSSDDPTDNFSGEISNDDSKPLSVSPPRPLSVTKPAVSQVGSSGTLSITRKLFSGLYRWRKPKHHSGFDTHGQPRKFSLGELQDATDQFSQKNLIRHGDHEVYRGQLADGSLVEVKVKRLIERSENGAEHQFQTEVEMACMVVHPNVLNLLGYCITPKQCMLVYPLMINGSVASCLRGGRYLDKHPLNWPIKKRIAIGSAKGLAYLHEGCDRKVIHRDVKSASILLDENFEAFLADLDLAKHLDHNEADVNTGIRGRSGVIAPEYLSTGICSEKSDVYGYGLFLLELITWKRTFDLARLANDDDLTLLDWVKVIFLEKKWEKIVDANCESDHLMEEVVEQLMQIALLCTQSTPKERPKMSEIVRMLEQNGDDALIQIMWEQWLKNEMLRHSVRTQKDD